MEQSLSDNVFAGAPNLKAIDVSYNDLSHIGKAFHDLDDVERIHLNRNHIDDIDLVAFAKLRMLKGVSLENSGFQWGKWKSMAWQYIYP